MDNRVSKLYIIFSRIKRKLLAKHTSAVRLILLTLIIVLVGGLITLTGNVIKKSYFFQVANAFLFTPDSAVESFEGRTNILLLGKSDGDINTPDLTDTMIFASIKIEEPRDITLVSIPRDIWVPEIKDKINASFRKGNEAMSGGGLVLAKSNAEQVVGQPIHYAIAIDSSHLVEVIDILGGVVIDIERSFTDNKFPIAGKENDDCGGDLEYKCRYETISFTQGLTKMDGVTALKYSRSRHAEEVEERTDFARSARQQKVIDAIKTNVLSTSTLTSYSKMRSLYFVARKSVETDLTDPQIAYLARRISQSRKSVDQHILGQDFFIAPEIVEEYNFLYVLVPRTGSWGEVHEYIENLL